MSPGLVLAVVFAVIFVVCSFVVIRLTTRNDDTPRRRDLRRAHRRYVEARRTILEVDAVVDRYRQGLDTVGDALVAEVKSEIRRFNEQIMEIDK